MQLYEHLLPAIGNADFIPVSTDAEPLNFSLTSVDVLTSNGKVEAIEM
jgi:hypothetical protein